jgi:hypothetical protein
MVESPIAVGNITVGDKSIFLLLCRMSSVNDTRGMGASRQDRAKHLSFWVLSPEKQKGIPCYACSSLQDIDL